MKRGLVSGVVLIGIAVVLMAPTTSSNPDDKRPAAVYLGNQWCLDCHQEAYRLWIGSPHSRTWVQLHSRGAMPIGLAEGWRQGDPMPVESALCLSCHALGAALVSSAADNFHIEEGVQCEACHGPAGVRVQAASGGDSLVVDHGGMTKADEKTCLRCHIMRSSHSRVEARVWDFASRWRRIQHGMEK
ncbi:multiheme c-type cytochrome [candidate division KSB1 bacterium]